MWQNQQSSRSRLIRTANPTSGLSRRRHQNPIAMSQKARLYEKL